jgi:outer membrane protein assembly factor BamB
MFESSEQTSWTRSTAALIGFSIIFPPLGLALLWSRSGVARRTQLLASVVIVALAGGYVFLFWRLMRSRSNDDHYAQLEQQRAQQRAEAAQNPAANPVTTTPVAAPGASPAPAAAGGQAVVPTTPETAHAAKNYWTNYRGPNRDGRYEETSVLSTWPANGLTPIWKQPVGLGYASFSIADGRAYTIEQRRQQEVVAAYDINTGRELWTQGWNANFTDAQGDGPRTTPTWDNGRLYALGATGELRSLDAATGKVFWGKNILTENRAENLQWAQAASPLVVDDKVIVLPGGTSGNSIVAYNKMTGAPVWKSQNDRQAYVSPMLVTLSGRRQVLVVSAARAMGLAPEDGSLLWSYPWDTDSGINCSQPIVVAPNRFFISAGYGKGAALVEVTGSGKSFTAKTLWENVNMKNKFNSSVFHNGYVYGLDEQILTCVDVNTGERKWKGGRYGYGQVVLAGNNLIILTDGGELVLVRATPDQHSEVARFQAIEGKSWNYPAIADGRLLIRNANEMAAYNITGQ